MSEAYPSTARSRINQVQSTFALFQWSQHSIVYHHKMLFHNYKDLVSFQDSCVVLPWNWIHPNDGYWVRHKAQDIWKLICLLIRKMIQCFCNFNTKSLERMIQCFCNCNTKSLERMIQCFCNCNTKSLERMIQCFCNCNTKSLERMIQCFCNCNTKSLERMIQCFCNFNTKSCTVLMHHSPKLGFWWLQYSVNNHRLNHSWGKGGDCV